MQTPHERELLEALEALREEYAKRAEPYLKALAAIRAARPPKPVILSYEEAKCIWPDPPSGNGGSVL